MTVSWQRGQAVEAARTYAVGGGICRVHLASESQFGGSDAALSDGLAVVVLLHLRPEVLKVLDCLTQPEQQLLDVPGQAVQVAYLAPQQLSDLVARGEPCDSRRVEQLHSPVAIHGGHRRDEPDRIVEIQRAQLFEFQSCTAKWGRQRVHNAQREAASASNTVEAASSC